jgi:hypothetical protein
LYRRLGGPQGQCGQVRKILPPPGFHPQTVQPVASHYTVYTTQLAAVIVVVVVAAAAAAKIYFIGTIVTLDSVYEYIFVLILRIVK